LRTGSIAPYAARLTTTRRNSAMARRWSTSVVLPANCAARFAHTYSNASGAAATNSRNASPPADST
jgi:hypothetical protein